MTKLVGVIQETGNQLAERIADFLTLQSKEIIIPAAHESTKGMLATEIQQYESFARERLSEKTEKFSDPIKRNNMMLIAGRKRKEERHRDYPSLKP